MSVRLTALSQRNPASTHTRARHRVACCKHQKPAGLHTSFLHKNRGEMTHRAIAVLRSTLFARDRRRPGWIEPKRESRRRDYAEGAPFFVSADLDRRSSCCRPKRSSAARCGRARPPRSVATSSGTGRRRSCCSPGPSDLKGHTTSSSAWCRSSMRT